MKRMRFFERLLLIGTLGLMLPTGVLVASTGQACSAALQEMREELYLSSPDAPKVEAYLQNARATQMREQFFLREWRTADGSLSFEEFRAHLSNLHRILSLGEDRKNAFMHPGSGRNSFMSQNIQPGQYRSLEHYFRDLVYPFRQTEPRESKATNNSFHWGLRKFFPEMALAPSSEQKGQFSYAIPMDGIPREGWPKNQAFRDSMGFAQIRHTYPPTSIPYLEPMFEIYRELLKMPTGAKDPRVLENIARYYHYGINAHLFHRINNSLLMIQVNNFLELQGWRGGYHRDLDVYAVNMDFPSFFEKFRDWLKQANPE